MVRPSLSVVICTFKRSGPLVQLLHCLKHQEFLDFEVLVIDGSGQDNSVFLAVEKFIQVFDCNRMFRIIRCEKGLTRQRNVGIVNSTGDFILFLDDDVTFASNFLDQLMNSFGDPAFSEVGGLTGFDKIHYGRAPSPRFRLKTYLGFYPNSSPGAIGKIGLSVPLTHLKPFDNAKFIDWLPGFCMAYRREAIGDLRFDTNLPTYAGEDSDFSRGIRKEWRLAAIGNLILSHHRTENSRPNSKKITFECAFGVAYKLFRDGSKPNQLAWLSYLMAVDFILDLLPMRNIKKIPFKISIGLARLYGYFSGIKTGKKVFYSDGG